MILPLLFLLLSITSTRAEYYGETAELMIDICEMECSQNAEICFNGCMKRLMPGRTNESSPFEKKWREKLNATTEFGPGKIHFQSILQERMYCLSYSVRNVQDYKNCTRSVRLLQEIMDIRMKGNVDEMRPIETVEQATEARAQIPQDEDEIISEDDLDDMAKNCYKTHSAQKAIDRLQQKWRKKWQKPKFESDKVTFAHKAYHACMKENLLFAGIKVFERIHKVLII